MKRTKLLLITIFVVTILFVGACGISEEPLVGKSLTAELFTKNDTPNNPNDGLDQNILSIITFEIDWEAIDIDWEMEDWIQPDPLTVELIREIANLPYVEAFDYSIVASAQSSELLEYWPGMEDDLVFTDEFPLWAELRGTSEAQLLQERAEIIELVEGRMFTDAEITTASEINPVIVPSGFARINNFSIGSTFTLDVIVRIPDPDGDWFDLDWFESDESIYAERRFEFEIIGIFDMIKEIDFNNFDNFDFFDDWMIYRMASQLHVSNVVAEEMRRFEIDTWLEMMLELDTAEETPWMNLDEHHEPQLESTMILRDSLELENFRAAAMELLPEFWLVNDTSIPMID